MTIDFAAAMRRAALFTRGRNVIEATRVIQDAIARRMPSGGSESASSETSPRPKQASALKRIDPGAEIVEPVSEPEGSSAGIGGTRGQTSRRVRRPLGDVVQLLREGKLTAEAFKTLPGVNLPGLKPAITPPPIADGAQFLTRSFACAAGSRNYKLYIPACAPKRPRGLIVMLHGCQQTADDFAAGTAMNTVAEAHGLLVAYPSQTSSFNAQSCWNWFSPANQMRDAGEPSIIAGITRTIMSEFGVDRHHVFVAGLSAGGAMAAVMGETYPDLYAGVGIHSGLAYGSANDAMTAFAAMRGNPALAAKSRPRAATKAEPRVRTIVFQGGADHVVHPSNADRIVAAASADVVSGGARTDGSRSAGGRTYTRTVIASPDGGAAVEYWLVDGAGHAWSGGCPSGSYTDPDGPDASAEMVRFFLNRPR